MNLNERMERFLMEGIDTRKLGVGEVVGNHLDLIGQLQTGARTQIGMTQFLLAHGAIDPQVTDLSSTWIGRFYGLQIQHAGAIRSGQSMRHLRHFWEWMVGRGYLIPQAMPPDLKMPLVDEPIEVTLSIHGKEIRG